MFQIESGPSQHHRVNVYVIHSVFDALPLNFYAKPCGIHRCSKAFTCYFVVQYIICYKLINRWRSIWRMEEIITIFQF